MIFGAREVNATALTFSNHRHQANAQTDRLSLLSNIAEGIDVLVRIQVPPLLRPMVPSLSFASSAFVSAPVRTSKRQPSGAAESITGSTHAFRSSLVDNINHETSGTMAPLAAGSGERTVRAQSQAITVASEPSGSLAFG
jgi:hypothetical protein